MVDCWYEFRQAVDETGKPTSRPEGGKITMVIPSTNDDDMFWGHAIEIEVKPNGEIISANIAG